MAQIATACRALDIVPCGGHTEITYGLDRPIVVGVMLGDIEPGSLIRSSDVQVGDLILLTKGAAVEGTAIIAREKERELGNTFSADFVARCQNFLHDPGISVVREARIATETAVVHAMHDPTEGGIATGLWELAEASGIGLDIDAAAVHIFDETQRLCRIFGLDPWGVIASGALLIATPQDSAPQIVNALHQADIPVAPIARALPAECGLTVHSDKDTSVLPRFDQDEITRIF
jgi:hydrogenase maturation factor